MAASRPKAADARPASSKAAPAKTRSKGATPGVAEPEPPAVRTTTSWLAAYPALKQMLAKIGIHRPADLITHLPLRYEDHTRLTPLADVVPGVACQIEGTVIDTEIHYRPRRQLVTTLSQRDGQVVLRFLHFYPSQQKTLAPGRRIRAFGEPRVGFFGVEMIHPTFGVVGEGESLPDALTPVYPTTAGLAQSALRKLVARQIERDPVLLKDSTKPELPAPPALRNTPAL